MKREILFRGKRIDNGEWVEGDLIQLHKNAEYWYILPNGVSSELYEKEPYPFRQNDVMCEVALAKVIPETVGEYTGLTDKNGVKIFEGDIVKATYIERRCDSNGEHYNSEFELIEEVVFEHSAFMLKTDIEDIAMYRPLGFKLYEKTRIKTIEIIGNIHDNPELLEE